LETAINVIDSVSLSNNTVHGITENVAKPWSSIYGYENDRDIPAHGEADEPTVL
jgi:hypothetical protein